MVNFTAVTIVHLVRGDPKNKNTLVMVGARGL